MAGEWKGKNRLGGKAAGDSCKDPSLLSLLSCCERGTLDGVAPLLEAAAYAAVAVMPYSPPGPQQLAPGLATCSTHRHCKQGSYSWVALGGLSWVAGHLACA